MDLLELQPPRWHSMVGLARQPWPPRSVRREARCLGNELDGPWQMGHKTAEEYGRLAAETARKMRMIDPGLELIACGSSHSGMPTFGTWEATVLEHAYDRRLPVAARLLPGARRRHRQLPASALDMEAFIESVIATADHVRAKTCSRKRINLSFDE